MVTFAMTGQALSHVSGGQVWCHVWYSLVFLVGVTSVLTVLTPCLSYIQSLHLKYLRPCLVMLITILCLVVSIYSRTTFLSPLTKWGTDLPCLVLSITTTTTFSCLYPVCRATDRVAAQDGCKMNLPLLRYLQLVGSISPLIMVYFSISFLLTTIANMSWSISDCLLMSLVTDGQVCLCQVGLDFGLVCLCQMCLECGLLGC